MASPGKVKCWYRRTAPPNRCSSNSRPQMGPALRPSSCTCTFWSKRRHRRTCCPGTDLCCTEAYTSRTGTGHRRTGRKRCLQTAAWPSSALPPFSKSHFDPNRKGRRKRGSQEKQRAYDRDERGQRDEHRVRRSSEAAPENRTELGQPLFAWAATAKIIGNFRSF